MNAQNYWAIDQLCSQKDDHNSIFLYSVLDSESVNIFINAWDIERKIMLIKFADDPNLRGLTNAIDDIIKIQK